MSRYVDMSKYFKFNSFFLEHSLVLGTASEFLWSECKWIRSGFNKTNHVRQIYRCFCQSIALHWVFQSLYGALRIEGSIILPDTFFKSLLSYGVLVFLWHESWVVIWVCYRCCGNGLVFGESLSEASLTICILAIEGLSFLPIVNGATWPWTVLGIPNIDKLSFKRVCPLKLLPSRIFR